MLNRLRSSVRTAFRSLISRAVRRLDAWLRRRLRIFEFTDDPRCILRLSLHTSRSHIDLPRGAAVPGDVIGELHLWNEHLPRIGPGGPNVAWAGRFHRQLIVSLRRLAAYVQHDAAAAGAVAFCIRPMFEGWGRAPRLPRLVRRLGFEAAPVDRFGVAGGLANWGRSLLTRAMLLAFNPAGIRDGPLHRRPQEFWITRSQLLDRYGRPHPQRVAGSADERDRPSRGEGGPVGGGAFAGESAGRARLHGPGGGPRRRDR